MKASELRALSAEELAAKEVALRGEYFQARVKKATSQLESTTHLRTLRRDIARVATLLRERQMAAGAGDGETA